MAGKENMVPWPKPKGYDPNDFLLMQRCVDAGFKGVMSGKEENNSVLEYTLMYIYIMYRWRGSLQLQLL